MQVCWNELNLISLQFLILFRACHRFGCGPVPSVHPPSPPAQLLPLSGSLLLIRVASSAPCKHCPTPFISHPLIGAPGLICCGSRDRNHQEFLIGWDDIFASCHFYTPRFFAGAFDPGCTQLCKKSSFQIRSTVLSHQSAGGREGRRHREQVDYIESLCCKVLILLSPPTYTVNRPQQLTSARCLRFQDCKRRPA